MGAGVAGRSVHRRVSTAACWQPERKTPKALPSRNSLLGGSASSVMSIAERPPCSDEFEARKDRLGSKPPILRIPVNVTADSGIVTDIPANVTDAVLRVLIVVRV